MAGPPTRLTLARNLRGAERNRAAFAPKLLTEAGDLYPYGLQEAGELGGSSELGYRLEFLERRREGVREAPQCARFEFRVSRAEVEIVDLACQVLRSI